MAEEKAQLMRISDLERRSGIKRRTIHFYMSEGLLSPPTRTGQTMAYYGEVHVDELKEIRRMQQEGYTLSLIRDLMSAVRSAHPQKETGAKSDKKARLIEKAVELFSRRGYTQTKISDITGAVGVGQSTFYLYFPSKKVLFLECVDKVFQAMFEDVWEEIKTEEHPIRRLLKRAQVVLKSHPQFVDMLRVLGMEEESDPVLEVKRKNIYESILETVEHDLRGAAKMGLISPEPSENEIEILAYVLVGFIETAALVLNMRDYSVDALLAASLKLTRLKLKEADYKTILEV